MTTNDQHRQEDARERQARILAATGDFLRGASRRGKAGRARPAQPTAEPFMDMKQNAGTEER